MCNESIRLLLPATVCISTLEFASHFQVWKSWVEGSLCVRVGVCKGVWRDVASSMTQLSSVHIVTLGNAIP